MRWSDRYDSLFRWFGQKYQVPWRLLKSQAFAESRFDPDAVSSAGAMGLSQFMPKTAREWGLKDPKDPEEAIAAQAQYMVKLYTSAKMLLHGIVDDEVLLWRLAAASYNCGWGYVRAALKDLERTGKPITWEAFAVALPDAVYVDPNGISRKARATETLPYVLKVVPDASVLADAEATA